jgi:hypothetical protein
MDFETQAMACAVKEIVAKTGSGYDLSGSVI